MFLVNSFLNRIPILLDSYSGAIAAYSVARKLRIAYTGYAFRVRRSSDNSELDIGFNFYNEIDEKALKAFVGSNSAYISFLYDQSGNGYNAYQSTQTLQPKIVNAGNIIKVNNRITIDFNGFDDSLQIDTWNLGVRYSDFTFSTNDLHISIISGFKDVSVTQMLLNQYTTWTPNIDFVFRFVTTIKSISFLAGDNIPIAITTGTNSVLSTNILYSTTIDRESGTTNYYLNNTFKTSTAVLADISNDRNGIRIGRSFDNDEPLNGYMSELIIYNSSQSSNRTNIYNNQKLFYKLP